LDGRNQSSRAPAALLQNRSYRKIPEKRDGLFRLQLLDFFQISFGLLDGLPGIRACDAQSKVEA
jgi:hypothetical protein